MLQTVRVWQRSEDGNYDCKHTLKDHTAEVNMFFQACICFITSESCSIMYELQLQNGGYCVLEFVME